MMDAGALPDPVATEAALAAAGAELVDRLGVAVRRGEPLGPRCTYRVGGAAAIWVEPTSIADLEVVAAVVASEDVPTLAVGKGSNLLVADTGFPGVVVHLGDAFESVAIDHEGAVARIGGAAMLPVAARKTAAAGLTGFEWAVGVPGSVGGGVRMNAGGHGSDMDASVQSATVFDLLTGSVTVWSPADLDFAYRCSAIGSHHLVLDTEIQLAPGDPEKSSAEISEIVRWRRANQPGGQNAGSVFTNPPGDSAGRLIDVTGLKGFRIGTAEVSPKHANFIQADPDGSAADVHAVITEVRRRVYDEHGIELHCENLLIGFEPLGPLQEGTVN